MEIHAQEGDEAYHPNFFNDDKRKWGIKNTLLAMGCYNDFWDKQSQGGNQTILEHIQRYKISVMFRFSNTMATTS